MSFKYFKYYSGRKGTEKEIELIRNPSRLSLNTFDNEVTMEGGIFLESRDRLYTFRC